MARKIKLSTAMLKGAKTCKETRNNIRDLKGACCAIGSALVGACVRFPKMPSIAEGMDIAQKVWPRLGGKELPGRGAGCVYPYEDSLGEQISELHLSGRWSRKKIANWLKKHGL